MITLYTNHCPLCNALKDLLDQEKIQYEEVTDEQFMLSLGITRTPVLEVNKGEFLKYRDALKWVETRKN